MVKNADMVLLASAIRGSRPPQPNQNPQTDSVYHAWLHTVDAVIDALHQTNPRLNVEVFKMACGVN